MDWKTVDNPLKPVYSSSYSFKIRLFKFQPKNLQNDADSLEKSLRAYLESDNLLGGGLRHAELMRVSTDEEQSWQRLARHSYSQTFAISQYAKVKDAVESNRDADDADAIRHFLVALALRSIIRNILLYEISSYKKYFTKYFAKLFRGVRVSKLFLLVAKTTATLGLFLS